MFTSTIGSRLTLTYGRSVPGLGLELCVYSTEVIISVVVKTMSMTMVTLFIAAP